nr:hypothetical protein [Tanacetum cinerariifolium]
MPEQVQLKKINNHVTQHNTSRPSTNECLRTTEKDICNFASTIISNLYRGKSMQLEVNNQRTMSMRNSQNLLASVDVQCKKFATKSICSHQQQVQLNDKQICTLQKGPAKRLDNNNAQVTSKETVVPRVRHCHNSHAKRIQIHQ